MRDRHSQGERHHGQQGFTLVELLVVVAIIPLVVGAISVALISVLTQQSTVQGRLADSSDAQQVSATFVKDVTSATYITTTTTPPNTSSTTPPVCGPLSPFLSLEWSGTTANTVDVVSYAASSRGSADKLVRQFCQYTNTTPGTNPPTWSSAADQSSHVIADDVQNLNTPAVLAQDLQISGESCNNLFTCDPSASSDAQSKWTATAGVSGVQLTVLPQVQTDQSFQYQLTGVPQNFNSVSSGQNPGGNPSLVLLGSTGGPDVSCSGNGTLTVENGPADFDTQTGTAAATGGNGSITAPNGGFYTDGGTLNGTVPATPNNTSTFTPDPYSTLPPPVSGLPVANGTHTVTAINGQVLPVINGGGNNNYAGPGVYTQQLSFTTGTVLASGIYVLEAGLKMSGNASNGPVDGSAGVLIYNFGGSISDTGSAGLDLAPLSTPLWPNTNIVIWQDASDTQGLTLAGNGAVSTITGTIYAPTATVGANGSGKGGGVTAGSVVAAGISPCSGNGSFAITG